MERTLRINFCFIILSFFSYLKSSQLVNEATTQVSMTQQTMIDEITKSMEERTKKLLESTNPLFHDSLKRREMYCVESDIFILCKIKLSFEDNKMTISFPYQILGEFTLNGQNIKEYFEHFIKIVYEINKFIDQEFEAISYEIIKTCSDIIKLSSIDQIDILHKHLEGTFDKIIKTMYSENEEDTDIESAFQRQKEMLQYFEQQTLVESSKSEDLTKKNRERLQIFLYIIRIKSTQTYNLILDKILSIRQSWRNNLGTLKVHLKPLY